MTYFHAEETKPSALLCVQTLFACVPLGYAQATAKLWQALSPPPLSLRRASRAGSTEAVLLLVLLVACVSVPVPRFPFLTAKGSTAPACLMQTLQKDDSALGGGLQTPERLF